MKELLEFFRDRMTNKFFMPFIFFFVVENWKIIVWLALGKEPASVIENISLYIGMKGYIFLIVVPFFEAMIFSIVSPWLSLAIECLIGKPNLWRRQNKIRAEEKVIEAQYRLADAQYTLAQKQNMVKGQSRSGDVVIFGNISQRLDEAGFKKALNAIENSNDKDDFNSAIKMISDFSRYASLTDQRFYDEGIRKCMDDIIAEIDEIIDVQGERPRVEVGKDKFIEGISKIRRAYNTYRVTVRDQLGI